MALKTDSIVQVLLRERLRVTALASAVTRDVHAADDIFQEVVLAALESRAQFRGPDHVLAWALRAARHRAVDCARRKRLHLLPDEILEALEARWADPLGGAYSDRGEALHGCLGQLTASARELLQMRYAEGLTAVEVAARLCRTVDAVYQTLSRIHRALRECVERALTGHEPPNAQGDRS
jgi:RNA polymerase sigma-70 factor (ECF subfamily)